MKDEVRRRQEQGGAELDDLPLDLEMDEAKLLQQQIDALPLEQRELYVPSTGAKITHAAAKQRLYYFCDKLPSDRSACSHFNKSSKQPCHFHLILSNLKMLKVSL